jgi:hypothetical protein
MLKSLDRLCHVVWSAYPPVALLLGALISASGCAPAKAFNPLDRTPEPAVVLASSVTTPPPAYPQELPIAGTAAARGIVLYGADRIDLMNLGTEPWSDDARLWVNNRYSVLLPPTEPGLMMRLPFELLRDANGIAFPTNNREIRIETAAIQVGDELAAVRVAIGY